MILSVKYYVSISQQFQELLNHGNSIGSILAGTSSCSFNHFRLPLHIEGRGLAVTIEDYDAGCIET